LQPIDLLMEQPGPGRVVALAADLLFASRIRAAAEKLGIDLVLARSPAAVVQAVDEAAVRLVLIDLDGRYDAAELITKLKAPGGRETRVVAFVSHVREAAIHAARAAGADRVLARSAFVQQLNEILTRAAS
jgi:CheY-like chemotaxis protein